MDNQIRFEIRCQYFGYMTDWNNIIPMIMTFNNLYDAIDWANLFFSGQDVRTVRINKVGSLQGYYITPNNQ